MSNNMYPSVNSLYSIGESGPSSDCHSDYGPHNQYGQEYSLGGSVCNLDSLPNYGDIDRSDYTSSDYASEASSYYSSIDRRSEHQNHAQPPPHDQHPPYGGVVPPTYNMTSHHASPATSPNHSTDLAIREGDRWTSAVLVDAPHRSPSPDPLAHYHSKPAVLEAFGWHVVSVLPRDWVDDSERVLERLVRQLRQKE